MAPIPLRGLLWQEEPGPRGNETGYISPARLILGNPYRPQILRVKDVLIEV